MQAIKSVTAYVNKGILIPVDTKRVTITKTGQTMEEALKYPQKFEFEIPVKVNQIWIDTYSAQPAEMRITETHQTEEKFIIRVANCGGSFGMTIGFYAIDTKHIQPFEKARLSGCATMHINEGNPVEVKRVECEVPTSGVTKYSALENPTKFKFKHLNGFDQVWIQHHFPLENTTFQERMFIQKIQTTEYEISFEVVNWGEPFNVIVAFYAQ